MRKLRILRKLSMQKITRWFPGCRIYGAGAIEPQQGLRQVLHNAGIFGARHGEPVRAGSLAALRRRRAFSHL
jgi:hypothetical protein